MFSKYRTKGPYLMSAEDAFPYVDLALVEALKGAFPSKLPESAVSDVNELNVVIGVQKVIRFLENHYNAQERDKESSNGG